MKQPTLIPNETPKDDEYEEIESDFFRFENIGDKTHGKLTQIGKSKRFGFGEYTLETIDGKLVRMHGSTTLDTLMSKIIIGDVIKIELIDLVKTQPGMNDLKVFSVKRQK